MFLTTKDKSKSCHQNWDFCLLCIGLVGLLALFTVKKLLGIDSKHGYYFTVRLSWRLTLASSTLWKNDDKRRSVSFSARAASKDVWCAYR